MRGKANWIGLILRRNCLLHNVTEGQTTEMKGEEKENIWEAEEDIGAMKEDEDRNRWKRQFSHERKKYKLPSVSHGPANKSCN